MRLQAFRWQKHFECSFDAKQICAKNQMRYEQVVTHIKSQA